MGGGLSLRFNTGGAQSDVYNFSGNIVSSSESMTFGDGTYNIRGDIISSGSSVTEFGSGVFNVGGAIRNDGNRMIFGDGTYDVAKGIYTSYGVTEFGAGSFRIGPASNGNAIELRSGELFMGDVNVDHGGIFEVTGRIETGGGSCLEVPAAAVHEINGPISVEGAVTFGAGFYAVDGYMHAVTGGASCRG